jgi:Na+/melibiose symporter-like transporter
LGTTKASTLVGLFLAGAIVMFFGEVLLVRLGEPQFTPPITLGAALFFIGLILPTLAWPIRSVTKPSDPKKHREPVNPFYATRVLLLAKAGALTGALLTGAAMGIVVFIASRVVIAVGPLVLAGSAVVGGVVLTVGSVLAEQWCRIPPSSTDRELSGEGESA